nr:PaaX family transcriptional regulator C-terminal domain-containing protein [Actinomadura sp. CNU-125]
MWISPHDVAEEAARSLAELDLKSYSVVVARVPAGVPQGLDPLDAWDLAELRARYDRFVAEREGLLRRVLDGDVSTSEALLARTEVMDTWRHFPNLDPELPPELLPADWPLRRAHDMFARLYDELGPPAEIRVRQIVTGFSPALGELVRHHTTHSVIDAE